MRIDGGTHSGFSDSDSSQSPQALEAQHDSVKRAATALLNRYLALKPKFAKRLRTSESGGVALTAKLK